MLVRSTMRNPFDFFDVIYCINLDTRPDRWEQAMHEFATIGIADRVERVAGITHVDPREGCRLSHLACVQRAAAAAAQTALIFEDDVTFPGFSDEQLARSLDRLRTVSGWDLFYLGGLVSAPPMERDDTIFRAPIVQTHAYAIHRRAFAAVQRSDAPLDLWYAAHLKSYCARPLLAWQRDGLSDIDGAWRSRANDARRLYVHFIAAPHAESIVRAFAERHLKGHLLRLRLERRLRRGLSRLATRFGVR
jgi:glycosyl transferase family 25